jgi:hypothetical protein
MHNITNHGTWHQKPLILCGHRKTGTTLLLSLLDSHPQLCVFPPDSGFFYGYYPIYDFDKYTDDEKKQRIIDVLFYNFKKDLERWTNLKADHQRLAATYWERMRSKECSPEILLSEAIFAFQETFGGSNASLKRWVEKTTSTEIYAEEVFQWFPDAKMIHVVRDPRDNFASLKSGWVKRYQKFNDSLERLLQSMIDRGLLGMKLASLNLERYGEQRYKVIRYEDLTGKPQYEMEELCQFAEIEFDEILMRPSYFGEPWMGNNFDGLSFDKPSAVNVGRWRERITDHEAALVELYFGNEMMKWGYELAYSLAERIDAGREHYKWHNFAQVYSATSDGDTYSTKKS